MKKNKLFLTAVLLSGLLMFSGGQIIQAEETHRDFFGQGNSNIDPAILNTQDEEDAGSLNQGWDGATGEVVPMDAEVNVPEVGEPVPVDTGD